MSKLSRLVGDDVVETMFRAMWLRLARAPAGDPRHLFMADASFKGDGAW